eukprot:scaffold119489_cov28-Tisochrysis_lutea.AAC.3
MSILRLNERRLVGPPRVATAGAATDASMGGVTNSVEASTLDDCSALGWGSFSPSPPGALGDPMRRGKVVNECEACTQGRIAS